MCVSIIKNLSWCTVVMGLSNIVVIILGTILIEVVYPACGPSDMLPFIAILFASCIRIFIVIRTGIAQKATATMVLNSQPSQSAYLDTVIRRERRIRYKRWLLWTRLLMISTVLQFIATTYLMLIVVRYMNQGEPPSNCIFGYLSKGTKWQHNILILFTVLVFYVAMMQCFTGSEVLRWRAFYATEDDAWKTHYSEVFNQGIREALCCLGRVKYLSVLEEDEVYSVAELLGELVAYRAAGTGHLELLAGLALLHRSNQPPKLHEGCLEASKEQIQEAFSFHPFAQAAYTGLLLDIGRSPILFPCVWLYRQGILTPWTWNRRPVLQGDNWWRGHAAAFLKYVKLSPEALRQGRVNQAKCEAAYFIVVLHHLKSVVITVRGTETPEDLITDGLCRECTLSVEDLDGLINGNRIHPDVKHRVISSMPHYGHSGIVEAARDLFMQIDGNVGDAGFTDVYSDPRGFLSSLLGAGCECDGYRLCIVGHSLGGAIAALLGLRLLCRYPNLHVYAYGPLPCLDPVIADACSEFVTSIIYNNEFSARLSIASILRLRGAALTAVSQDTAESTITSKLASRFLFLSKCEKSKDETKIQNLNSNSHAMVAEDGNLQDHNSEYRRSRVGQEAEFSLWEDGDMENGSGNEINQNDLLDDFINPFHDSSTSLSLSRDPVSEFMDTVSPSQDQPAGNLPEMFLPGTIIHVVPNNNGMEGTLWKNWRIPQKYKVYTVDRNSFKDIIVSPSMFLDHLPWRCDFALRKALEEMSAQNLYERSDIV